MRNDFCIEGKEYDIVDKSAYNLFNLINILRGFTEQKRVTSDDIFAIDYVLDILSKEVDKILKCL